jgi:hypothetical protein
MKIFFIITLSILSNYSYAQNCQQELVRSLSQLTDFNYGASTLSNVALNNNGREAFGTLSFSTDGSQVTYDVETYNCMIKSAKLRSIPSRDGSSNCLQDALSALTPFYTHNFNLSDDSPTLNFTKKVNKKLVLIQHSFSQYATGADGGDGYSERIYNSILDTRSCVIQSVQLIL